MRQERTCAGNFSNAHGKIGKSKEFERRLGAPSTFVNEIPP
jgi:hypothetical protein